MPLLNHRAAAPTIEPARRSDTSAISPGRARIPALPRGLLTACANPACGSGWLHLWRSRSSPMFEGGWNCSPDCTVERLAAAVRRELDGRGVASAPHRHRIPLGLLMLEQGWITGDQLKLALRLQRENGHGRLGHWLVAGGGVNEQLITRALGLQWSCPVLSLEAHDPEGLAPLVPRLFVDAFGALPLRVAAGKLLYLGFEDRLDPVVSLAVERMTGLRVEGGLVQSSAFRTAHARMLRAAFPAVQLLEAVSEPVLVRSLAKALERAKPVESHLVRVHDCLWLRMWRRTQSGLLPLAAEVEDILCTVAPQ